jgi:hypothetical protein
MAGEDEGRKRRQVALPVADMAALERMTYDELRRWAISALWARKAELGSVNYLFRLTIDEHGQRVIVDYESQSG